MGLPALGLGQPGRILTASAIYTPFDGSSFGKAGKVSFVGFDCNETFIEALRRAHLNGVVVQDPLKMGYLGVKTMVQHLKGESVESRVDTGVALITAENLDDPQIQELIRPPLDEYLK